MASYLKGCKAYEENLPFSPMNNKDWQDGYIDSKATSESKSIKEVETELGLL